MTNHSGVTPKALPSQNCGPSFLPGRCCFEYLGGPLMSSARGSKARLKPLYNQ